MPNHRALAKVHFDIFYIYIIFEHVCINKKLLLRVVYLTGTQNRNAILLLLFSSIFIKKTYQSECLVTGHSQKFKLKSFTFISFSSMYLSTHCYLFEWFILRALKTET